MAMNIKNERVHDLARRAAEATGKTLTGAIEEALEKLLADRGNDPALTDAARRIDMAHSIAVDFAADPGRADAAIHSVEDLFDSATGLPVR